MASVTELIAAIAPAYTADTRLAVFTDIARSLTSRKRFGNNYELAVVLRVAHMIARNPMAQPGLVTQPGLAGAVTQAREGGEMQAYQIPARLQQKYGDLCSSPYGLQLANLIEGNVFAPFVVGGPMLNPIGRGR